MKKLSFFLIMFPPFAFFSLFSKSSIDFDEIPSSKIQDALFPLPYYFF